MARACRLVAALVLAGALLAPVAPALAAPAAPGFEVKVLDTNRAVTSRDLIGKRVLVLRFQASYCKPCARESAAFSRLVQRYAGRDVEFVAIHVQDTVADTRRFVRAQKVEYPVALDPKLVVAKRFGFKGTPYTVVVDGAGEMTAQIHGQSAIARLPKTIDQALATLPRQR